MADSYGTQLDTMQEASRHVADVNQQIQGQLSSLMSRLEPLSAAWKGSSAVSFQALHQRWNENAAKLNDALSDISQAIAVSGTTYQRSDESQQQSFSSITSVLG
ncbi:WXG100 family type VII secretion target [Motilibacter aurantiacus]|uniref:WXG100 family type VII secretion target n=1 Tax=Motilibacter aurantiacus TaxID=2714955 RepID=UPI0014080576|nr:WXG100 family type VII secretion target [Motilibacter aurantiacus]